MGLGSHSLDLTQVSCIARRFFTPEPPGDPPILGAHSQIFSMYNWIFENEHFPLLEAGLIPRSERSFGGRMATHSSILAWRILRIEEEPGEWSRPGHIPWGSKRVRHDLSMRQHLSVLHTSVSGVPCALIVAVFWCLAAANVAGIATWGTGRVHASTMSGVSWLCHGRDPGW